MSRSGTFLFRWLHRLPCSDHRVCVLAHSSLSVTVSGCSAWQASQRLPNARSDLTYQPRLPVFSNSPRQLGYRDDDGTTCDAAFMNCMDEALCVDCFLQLQTRDVDWASVTPFTPCEDVLTFLNQKDLCVNLKRNTESLQQFCSTFDSCVSWQDDDVARGDDRVDSTDDATLPYVDCSKLTKCDWEGFHPSFIGNGICNDGLYGCYNTEICGWDGGDCCEDTCKRESNYLDCGHDGYFCRDPTSKNCDSWYSVNCNPDMVDNDDAANDDFASMECTSEESQYRLIMYDSFGDGWDETKLSIFEFDKSVPFYAGSLRKGSQGTHEICLSKKPSCYNVKVMGGVWGNEVSWEIKPMMDSPAIAGGGAPMNCHFSVAGYSSNDCPLTW